MDCQLIVTLLLLGCGLLELSVEGRTSEELIITLPNGSRLAGRGLKSHDGRAIKAFMGIPYAQPPLNALRFKVNACTFFWIRFCEFLILLVQNPTTGAINNNFKENTEKTGSSICLYIVYFYLGSFFSSLFPRCPGPRPCVCYTAIRTWQQEKSHSLKRNFTAYEKFNCFVGVCAWAETRFPNTCQTKLNSRSDLVRWFQKELIH